MTEEYAALRAAHKAGAMILGVEDDGRMHRIENPEWTCPASRYLAVVPYQHPAEAPVALDLLLKKWEDRIRYARVAPAASTLRVRRDTIRQCMDELRAALEGSNG